MKPATQPPAQQPGRYAIFTRRTARTTRVMHAVRVGEMQTICRLDIGRGTDLVRDGDYHGNVPCPRCWA